MRRPSTTASVAASGCGLPVSSVSNAVAFLRAINVGGHVVRMSDLKKTFEALGFAGVETFIASGNVVFRSNAKSHTATETKIEHALEKALGYAVATFVRTCDEVAEIAATTPFTPAEHARAQAFVVGMLKAPLPAASAARVLAFNSDIDAFHVRGREVYWLCRRGQSESKFSNAVFERALGVPSTWRGIRTMQKMAAKYPGR